MIKVAISDEWAIGGQKVFIGRKLGDSLCLARFKDGRLEWGDARDVAEYRDDPPTLFLPEDVAEALYIALGSYFGSPADSRQLRADYDAERRRVDKFIDVIIQQAKR
jgi:hypothetical protein